MSRLRFGFTIHATRVAGVAIMSISPALAAVAPSEQSRAAVVQAVSQCRKIDDQTARLACYDRAADALDTAQVRGDIVVIDRQQAHEVRRQAFGFNLPSVSFFSHAMKDESIDRINVELTGAHLDPKGGWVMSTSDGAVWRQTDGADLYNPPHSGSKVAIRHAALGSFFCNVDGQPAIRCTRDR